MNSVLGQLRVIGDVGRDVLLTLSDPGASPVSIQVGGGDDGCWCYECACGRGRPLPLPHEGAHVVSISLRVGDNR